MYGVFDGHAGDIVSKHCAASLHENLRSLLRQHLLGEPAWSYDVVMEQALKDAFTQTDNDLKLSQLPGGSGSTATVAVVGKHHIWLAHCGELPVASCVRFPCARKLGGACSFAVATVG
jgi:serine/threonine protein phosphatase PrpC